jgi:transcriptional regulator
MHPNSAFRWEDRAALRAFATEIGFGMVFATTPDGPRVAHVPFVFVDEHRIAFHIACGNGIAHHLAGRDALIVVNGPDAYISPDWYGLDDQVPTWNYLSVEYEGSITQLDRDGLVAQVDALSATYEAILAPKPVWTRDKMSAGLFDKMLGGIIGFELSIKAARGTAKLGQNKPEATRAAVADALDHHGKRAMALLMRNPLGMTNGT